MKKDMTPSMNLTTKRKNQSIEKIISIAIVMCLLTQLLNPRILVCLFFSDLIMLFILLLYPNRKNQAFYQNVLLTVVGTWSGILMMKFIMGRRMRLLTQAEICFLCIMLAEICLILWHCAKKQTAKEEEKKLYPEREADLQRIKDYMMQIDLLGVNAGWGMGKSFLTTFLRTDEEIKKNFEVIQIDLLSCNLNEVELILVKEIEKVFKRNGIFPDNSYAMKRILGKNKWSELIGMILFHDLSGMAASFESYRNAFAKLDKKIVVIFEDIDRITDEKIIQKIFAISEKIACDQLHVIFQFDSDEIEKVGFDRDYLEKYIPYIVNLTEIEFADIVKYQWDELKMSETGLKIEDITLIMHKAEHAFQLEQLMGIELNLEILLPAVSIRKVRIFLTELKIVFRENKDFGEKSVRETVIATLFIKHFFYDVYQTFRIGQSPYEQLQVVCYDECFTIQGLVNALQAQVGESEEKKEERVNILNDCMESADNRCVIAMILLLGYDVFLQQPDGKRKNMDSATILKRQEKNAKIDRTIWKVLANGTSSITDAQNAVDKLIHEVLYKEKEEQKAAWDYYLEDMFYGRLKKGNKTIFRIGKNSFESLFEAMYICNVSAKDMHAFLRFYFSQYKEGVISLQFMKNLCYCNLRDKKNFFAIIRFFNGLKVERNFNDTNAYRRFFNHFLSHIAILGYCGHMEYWMLELSDVVSKNIEFVTQLLTQLSEDLQERKKDMHAAYVQQEFDDCIRFVALNLELVQCTVRYMGQEEGPHIRFSEGKSAWIHQDEVDRLKALKKKGSEQKAEKAVFETELENSYREGKLYLQEYEAVVRDD